LLKAKIRYANLAGMAKLRTFLLMAILMPAAVMSGSIPANASADNPVDELFTALRDRKFSEATVHFETPGHVDGAVIGAIATFIANPRGGPVGGGA
jgi:hypothetical protein